MWNTNINEAPKGKEITVERTVIVAEGEGNKKVKAKRQKEFTEFQRQQVWLWSKCGKLILSSWIPESDKASGGNRWSGLAEGEQPLAWHEYKIPEPFEAA